MWTKPHTSTGCSKKMEFKCGQSAEAGLRQIYENGYAEPYKGLNRKLLLLGIGFDPKKRVVSDWKLEL